MGFGIDGSLIGPETRPPARGRRRSDLRGRLVAAHCTAIHRHRCVTNSRPNVASGRVRSPACKSCNANSHSNLTQQEVARTAFSADLAKAREAIDVANSRTESAQLKCAA